MPTHPPRSAMPTHSPAPVGIGPVAPPLGDLAASPTGGTGDRTPARSTGSAPGPTAGADGGGADRQVGPRWRLVFRDDFGADARPGAFLSTYRDFGAYPWGWLDTSKRGHYDPDILSASGGILTMHLHTTADGIHHVAAPYPKLPGGDSNQLYGRYSVRFRADSVDGYKVAWLLWPGSENWDDGEIDFPEGDLTRTISAFMHHVGNPSEQDYFGTGAGFADWHVATIEWSPGKVAFFFDGRILGTSTTHVPTKPMHFVLQTETDLGSEPVPSTASGDVQVDWVSIWRYE
jgi:Glycosyl hydrolases family 16